MDGFFEKYGRVIIIAVAICFVLLFLTPMRNVVGSSINGFAGNFANKVGESLGAVKMPDGSGDIAKEKSSMLITGEDINSKIPSEATTVIFTDEKAPKGVTTTDLTVAKDGDVVGWLDGTTWKISTQDSKKYITFNTASSFMFNGLMNIKEIQFNNVDTSNVMYMELMFRDCSSLTFLDLSSFDTSSVADMQAMFYGCTNLTSLNLSSFDTSNVRDMGNMFYGCSSMTSLDLSSFNTSKVSAMSGMFWDCSNLTSLDLSNFDTSKVTDMNGMASMFAGCTNLTFLNLSSFNTSSVKDMAYMFYNCVNLTSIDLSGFDTSNVANMGGMFNGCTSLTSIDLSSFDTSKVNNMQKVFYGCTSLTNIYVSPKWSTDGIGSLYYSLAMFYNCEKLPNYSASVINATKAHTGPGGYLTLKA